jgi:hypothetical protein
MLREHVHRQQHQVVLQLLSAYLSFSSTMIFFLLVLSKLADGVLDDQQVLQHLIRFLVAKL